MGQYVDISYCKKFIPYIIPECNVLCDGLHDEELQALVDVACARLDTLAFSGRKCDTTQPQQFPRVINGFLIEVNEPIKYATLYILSDSYISTCNEYALEIRKLKALGVVSTSIGGASFSIKNTEKKIPQEALELLSPYMTDYSLGGDAGVSIF